MNLLLSPFVMYHVSWSCPLRFESCVPLWEEGGGGHGSIHSCPLPIQAWDLIFVTCVWERMAWIDDQPLSLAKRGVKTCLRGAQISRRPNNKSSKKNRHELRWLSFWHRGNNSWNPSYFVYVFGCMLIYVVFLKQKFGLTFGRLMGWSSSQAPQGYHLGVFWCVVWHLLGCGVRSWNYLLGFQFVSAIARKRGSMDWYSTPNMWHSSIYFHCEQCMESGGGYIEHSFALQWALANHLMTHLSYLCPFVNKFGVFIRTNIWLWK